MCVDVICIWCMRDELGEFHLIEKLKPGELKTSINPRIAL